MKPELRDLVVRRRLHEVAHLAAGTTRVLGRLVALTYDADAAVAWGAVEAMGVAAARVAEDDPDFVRHPLRRLHWLLQEESGGVCWHAPEAMAEIVARCPVLFADYVPIVVHLLLETAEEDLAHLRPGMLWALGRLGALAGNDIAEVLPSVAEALDHPDPQVRGTALWCLGRLGRAEALSERPGLMTDDAPCALFQDGELRSVTVGAVARAALGAEASA